MAEIVLQGGRVIDPSSGLDAIRDVWIRAGRVVEVTDPGARPTGPATDLLPVSGRIVTPGLLDLHGHWYLGSGFGIEVSACLRGGVTTTLDAGTAGFVNWESFRRQSIEGAPLRVLALLNVAALGIPYQLAGETEDPRLLRPVETAALIREQRDVLAGVKVRLSACAGAWEAALTPALAAADLAAVPVVVDIGAEGDGMPAVLTRMRAGDILTHCFTGVGAGVVGPDGRVRSEAWTARRRGVRFDVGHGRGSFSFAVARAALSEGFLPDSISTDLHRYSIESPVVDLPMTLSKFLHLGLTLPDVVARATSGPAELIGLDAPAIAPGARADLAVFRLDNEPTILRDATRTEEVGGKRLVAEWTIVGGQPVKASGVPLVLRPLLDADRETRQPRAT